MEGGLVRLSFVAALGLLTACSRPGLGADEGETGTGDTGGSGGAAECQTADQQVFPTPTGFPAACDPSLGNAPEGFLCCSDDPAAVGGVLPRYLGRYADQVETDTPFHAGVNNARSRHGICLQAEWIPPGAGLVDPGAEGCPVPCNPNWGTDEVGKICGAGAICCQTQELQAADCVLDVGLECWRPAVGTDIADNTVSGDNFPPGSGDPWAADTHATHQDPGGNQCDAFAAGDQNLRTDCFFNLNVADQRGLCLALSPSVQFCPLAQPGYIDPCEQRNLDEGRICG
jgi:hypothetical protein